MADLAGATARLVAIPSVTGTETELVHHILEQLGRHRAMERDGDVLSSPAPADGRPVVTLVGHLDTVPAQGNATVRQEGGRVHGLGSTDMKGGLAVMIELAMALPADAPVGLALVFYPGEEGPLSANGLTPLLQSGRFPPTDLAVILEPTDLAVQMGCLGTINAECAFPGKAAHSARPWLGDNAIHKAASLLAHLRDRRPHKVLVGRSLVYREVLSATMAEGGVARNVVPADFVINLNYRFAPGRSVEEAVADIEALGDDHGFTVTITDAAPAGPVCEGNPLLDRLLASGLPVEPKQAWTDVAQLGEAGIDAVNFGPGETALAHTADESVSVDALQRCDDALWALLTAP